MNWKEEIGRLLIALRKNPRLEFEPHVLHHIITNAIQKEVKKEKLKVIDDKIEMIERLKLETDVNICECGEEWKETDIADLINKYFKDLQKQREELK